MNVTLSRTSGYEQSKSIVLGDQPVQVGRDATADLQVLEKLISRRHCEFRKVNDGLLVRDLDSKNGTFVNNIRITERFLLPGETLVIGRTEFTVQFAVADPGTDAPPQAGNSIANNPPPLPAAIRRDAGPIGRQGDTELEATLDTVVLPHEDVVFGSARPRSRRPVQPDLAHEALPPPKVAVDSAGQSVSSQAKPQETALAAIGARVKSTPVEPDIVLAQVVEAWPRLPQVIRNGIMAMVKATLSQPAEVG